MRLSVFADSFFDSLNSPVSRDLKLNFKKIVDNGALAEADATAATLALATSLGNETFATAARERLPALDLTEDQIREVRDTAAIMGMLNVYYRFRHMLSAKRPEAAADYSNTGLRMSSLARPALGKERFEMLAFAVSVLNGCETCIAAHEKTLREAGVSVDKIHDLARLAAVMKGIQSLR